MNYCCAKCFGDRVLRKAIRDLSSRTGKCSYCDTEVEPLLEPPSLNYYLEILINAYRPEPSGKLLAPLLREEWGIFRHVRMDDFRAKDLLSEILNDHDIVRQPFVPAPYPGVDWLGSWEKLRNELMYKNRFFPDVDIDLPFFEEILAGLVLEPYEVPDLCEVPGLWFRARIQNQDTPFEVARMGEPPRRIASHGRANPAGIPYLYLGSKPQQPFLKYVLTQANRSVFWISRCRTTCALLICTMLEGLFRPSHLMMLTGLDRFVTRYPSLSGLAKT
jgi:hypothetical protein